MKLLIIYQRSNKLSFNTYYYTHSLDILNIIIANTIINGQVIKKNNCTRTTIFFSQVIQIATIRLALTNPVLGSMQKSLPKLFVAKRVSQAKLQNSVNLGKNAVSYTDGIHNSKKLVNTNGSSGVAISRKYI